MAKIRHKKNRTSLLHQDVGVLVLAIVYAVMHNLMAGIEVVVASHLALLPETRTSNPLSKLLRPVLEHKKIRALFGANLAGVMIIMGSFASASGVQLGTVGLTGWTTGPHLHLEVYEKGKVLNPLQIISAG